MSGTAESLATGGDNADGREENARELIRELTLEVTEMHEWILYMGARMGHLRDRITNFNLNHSIYNQPHVEKHPEISSGTGKALLENTVGT